MLSSLPKILPHCLWRELFQVRFRSLETTTCLACLMYFAVTTYIALSSAWTTANNNHNPCIRITTPTCTKPPSLSAIARSVPSLPTSRRSINRCHWTYTYKYQNTPSKSINPKRLTRNQKFKTEMTKKFSRKRKNGNHPSFNPPPPP